MSADSRRELELQRAPQAEMSPTPPPAEGCAACGSLVPPTPHLPRLVRCRDCGHVYAAEMPSPEEIRDLYSDGYFFGGEYFDYLGDEAAQSAMFRRHCQLLRQAVPSGRLLEIGSAYGFFLQVARQFWEVRGIDVTAAGCRYARERLGLEVVEGDFLETDLGAERFDVICLWDTIEHLRAPDAYIAQASALLRPGGVLALTTGDIGSLVARLQGPRWRLIHPPTHLHYFTQGSIRALLRRHGLEVEQTSYHAQYRTLRLVLYKLLVERMPGLEKPFGKLAEAPWLNLAFPLNLYDIMFVLARRRASP